MLETIAVILVVLWILGLVTSYTMGGFIHALLVIAVVVILVRVIQGSKRLRPRETRRHEPFRAMWRGAGPAGFLSLSRVVGSTNERDKTDPRTRETALNAPSPYTRLRYTPADYYHHFSARPALRFDGLLYNTPPYEAPRWMADSSANPAR